MHSVTRQLWILGILSLLVPAAGFGSKAAPEDDRGNIVIVFKDGHQQSFRLADISRIDFNTSAAGASASGKGRFEGRWKVGDGSGGTFFITLDPDGKAHKTIGGAKGIWTVVEGEARINWDDGWHDAIRKVGNKYQKRAFGPGSTFSDEPANVADATYTEPN
jgi:hypothetical protein